MSNAFNVPPPAPGPMVDKNGIISRGWWWFFFNLWTAVGKGVAPPPDEVATIAYSNITTPRDHSADIRDLKILTLSPDNSRNDDLERRLKALEDVVYGTRPHPSPRPDLDAVAAIVLGTH